MKTASIVLLLIASLPTFVDRTGSASFGDFGAYWVAGRCLVEGRNCYDPAQVVAVAEEHCIQQAFLTWNPPWTLAIFRGLAAMPFEAAALLWVALNVALAVAIGVVVGRRIGLTDFWSVVLTITFIPIGVCIGISQLSILVLAGAIGYRECLRSDRPILAGACLAVTSVKPHLVILVWLAALLSGTRRQRLGMVAGFACSLATAALVVVAIRPSIISEYLRALALPSDSMPTNYFSATPAMWLRWAWESALSTPDLRWLQFIPLVASGILLLWATWRSKWAGDDLFDASLVLSALALPYGWHYDQVLLLPAYLTICGLVARHARPVAMIVFGLVLYEGVFAIALGVRPPESWYAFFTLALSGMWFAIRGDRNVSFRNVPRLAGN